MLLYGYWSKSLTVGLGFSLGCIPALSVMTARLRQHTWQLWAI